MLLSCIVKFSNLQWYDVISFINSLQCQNEMSLRLAYYPPFEKGAEPLPRQLRYGEHTDYTGWECAGNGPGWQWWFLMFFIRKKKQHSMVSPNGSFIVF